MNLNTGGWASRVLTPLLRIIRSSPNATVPVIAISEPVNSETATLVNSDIALVAKGTGATLAQVPDGTIAGGNKRGDYATDLQKVRNAAAQVSSGLRAVIAGGSQNTASGTGSFVGAGLGNSASSLYSFVGAGSTNNASGTYSVSVGGDGNTASSNFTFVGGGQSNLAQTNTHATVCGGSTNTASGQYSFVGGGYTNTASGSNSFIGNGDTNTASGLGSVIGGGFFNQATGEGAVIAGGNRNVASGLYSFIGGGYRGSTRGLRGYHVFPACVVPIADVAGVSQSGLLVLGRQTTDATTTVLASNSSAASTTNQVILPNNAAYYFRGSVISGVTGGGDSKAFTFEGAIKRGANAASTAIVGTVIINTIAQDVGAAAWTIAITADTTNGGIAVTFTGAAATTIRTVAKIETTEMTY